MNSLIVKHNIADIVSQIDFETLKKDAVLHSLEMTASQGLIDVKDKKITSEKISLETIEWTKKLKDLMRSYEDIRVQMVSPLNEKVKEINGYINPLLKKLADIEKQAKYKCIQFQEKKEAEAAERQKKIDAKNQKKIENADEGDIPVLDTKNVERKSFHKGDGAGGSFTKKVFIKSIDIYMLPDKYKMPDEKMILKAVSAGIVIPGVSVGQKTGLTIR